MQNPNKASVAEIARHWNMTGDTVRRILKSAGVRPVSSGPDRYRWTAVWSLEGADWVAPADKAAFKAPLRKVTELGEIFPDTPARTITDWARKKKIPAIWIGSDWRFREVTLKRWQDNV